MVFFEWKQISAGFFCLLVSVLWFEIKANTWISNAICQSFFVFNGLRVKVRVMVLSATFNNILAIFWQSVLLVEETRVPGETTDLPMFWGDRPLFIMFFFFCNFTFYCSLCWYWWSCLPSLFKFFSIIIYSPTENTYDVLGGFSSTIDTTLGSSRSKVMFTWWDSSPQWGQKYFPFRTTWHWWWK